MVLSMDNTAPKRARKQSAPAGAHARRRSIREKKAGKAETDEVLLKTFAAEARTGLAKAAHAAGIGKSTAFHALRGLIEAYGIRFVPEIDLKNLRAQELSHAIAGRKKKELKALPQLADAGLMEFACFIKFIDPIPDATALSAAFSKIDCVQYASMLLSGNYDAFAYLLCRSFSEASSLASSLSSLLTECRLEVDITCVSGAYGYFPLTDALLKSLRISDAYKQMLLALNSGARGRLNDMGKNKDWATYAYSSLKKSGLLKRTTLYMSSPEDKFLGIVRLHFATADDYSNGSARAVSFMRESKGYRCVFIAETLAPYGIMAILNAKSSAAFESVKKEFHSDGSAAHVETYVITKAVFGSLGIR